MRVLQTYAAKVGWAIATRGTDDSCGQSRCAFGLFEIWQKHKSLSENLDKYKSIDFFFFFCNKLHI